MTLWITRQERAHRTYLRVTSATLVRNIDTLNRSHFRSVCSFANAVLDGSHSRAKHVQVQGNSHEARADSKPPWA